jgi:3'-phosphoadenosine 5'-phosphosulfate sulfotransferase (PAPS reductase)/FAD synthetase
MPPELFNPLSAYSGIMDSLSQLYLADPRPWLVGFSDGKDSTLVAALVFEAALAIPPAQRTKEIHVVCTDARVEIPKLVGVDGRDDCPDALLGHREHPAGVG